jgi:nitric oxide dioxygenase
MPPQTLDPDALRDGGAIMFATPDRFAALFYESLFIARPDLRHLFHADLAEQGRKLLATLAIVIDGVEDWERMAPILGSLARRHVSYGVVPEHYAVVGATFLATLAHLGADRAQVAAWDAAIAAITGEMIAAAYPRPARVPPPLHGEGP